LNPNNITTFKQSTAMAKAKNIFTPGKIKIATYIEDHNIDELTLKLFARIIEKITGNESI